MKAPDKIYINPMSEPTDGGYVGIAWIDAHRKMNEYIRKDLLMEWLAERKKHYQGLIPAEGAVAFICALDEVKHKIESI